MSPRQGQWWRAAALVLAGLAAAGGVHWYRTRGQPLLFATELEEAREEAKASRERAEALEKELSALREQLSEAEKALSADSQAAGGPRRLEAALASMQAQLNREWQGKVAAVEAALEQMRGRVAELESALDGARAESARLEQGRRALEDDLAAAKRVIAAMEQELKGKSDRLTSLEIAANQTQEQRRRAERQMEELKTALDQLEEINRRRELYLNNIFRRYREITDQYRTTVSRFDRSSEAAAIASNDLSRIQDAIALTEEDLRQLGTLNNRANQVLKRLQRKP